MTQAPHNIQLLRAKKYWLDKELKRNFFNFQYLTELSVNDIVVRIPGEVSHEDKVFLKCQGIYRGIRERVQLAAGRGSRKDITKKMAAKIALLLDDQYPLILSCTASWMGKISQLTVFDAKGDRKARIHLRVPFVPMRESSIPRKLRLSLTSEKEYFVDPAEGVEICRHILTFQFIDERNGEFMMRKMIFRYDLDGFEVTMYDRLALIEEALASSFSDPPSSVHSGSSFSFIQDYMNGGSSMHKKKAAPKANEVYLGSESDSEPLITFTNIVVADLLRIGFRWKSKLYILRCSNELDITMINILEIGSDFQMVFLFKREYIGRSHDITTMWETLMDIAEKHPTIAPLLQDQPVTEEMNNAANTATEADGIYCFVTYMNDSKAISIGLARGDGSPLFGSGFESVVQLEDLDDRRDMKLLAETLVGNKSITSLHFRNSYSDEFLRGNLAVNREVKPSIEDVVEEIPDTVDANVSIDAQYQIEDSLAETVQAEKIDVDSIVTEEEAPSVEPTTDIMVPDSSNEDANKEDPFDAVVPKETDTVDNAESVSMKNSSLRSVTFNEQFRYYTDVLAPEENKPEDSAVEVTKDTEPSEMDDIDSQVDDETGKIEVVTGVALQQIESGDEDQSGEQEKEPSEQESSASTIDSAPLSNIESTEDAMGPKEEEIVDPEATAVIVDSAIVAEDEMDSTEAEVRSSPEEELFDQEVTESCIAELSAAAIVEVIDTLVISVAVEETELYESIVDLIYHNALDFLLQNICDSTLQDLTSAKEVLEQNEMYAEEMKGKEYQIYEKEELARRRVAEEARILAEERQRQQEEARNRLLEEEREKRRKEAEAKQKEKEEVKRLEEEFRKKKEELVSVPYTVTKIKSGVDRTASNFKRDVFTPTLQKSIKRQPLSLFSPQNDDGKVQLPAYAYESAEGLKKALQSDDLSVGYSIGNSSTSYDELAFTSFSRSQTTTMSSKKKDGSEDLKPIKVMKSERNKFRERLLKKSLEGFNTLGYVDKQPLVYATHWNKKVAEYLQSLPSIKQLRKRLSTLQRTSPMELTVEERICALADTAGNTGEVIEKVKNIEYCSELKLASSAVDLRNLLSYFPGGVDILSTSAVAGTNIDLSGYSSDELDSLDGTTVSGFTQYAPSSVAGSTGNFGLNYDLIKPTEASRQRMRYMESHSPALPHLDISKGSPFVQSRANFFIANKSSASSKLRSSTSDAVFSPECSDSMLTTTRTKPSTTAPAINYKDTSETINKRLRNAIGIEVEDTNDDSSISLSIEDGQQSTSKRRGIQKKISSPAIMESHNPFEKKIFQRLNAGGDASSLVSEDFGSVGSANTSGTQKSHRFYAQFNALLDDMQTGEAVALVTRKHANFAQRDETLLKSDKYYIREFVEHRAARLLQQKSLLNQTF